MSSENPDEQVQVQSDEVLLSDPQSDEEFKFSNITPTSRELAVLQLPPEGIENQVEDPIKTTSKDFDIPRASESEVQVWMKELLDFRKETINNLDGIDSKTVEHETINNSNDIGSKTDDNEVVCLNSYVRNLIKVDDVFSAPRPVVSREVIFLSTYQVPQPSIAFDIPQKAVLEVSEEAHELPQVSEEAHEHAEEQFPCPVPIQSVDPMNVTTHSQFELDDHFMLSFNSIKSKIAPQSTTIADQITTTVNQTSIDVQIGTNQERIMYDQTNISNDQT
ncbi:hypothetical protein KY290_007979 [Solanum tuberosum]|uniref:Uncharacterized protein n=1 Tax=Solanum tuberosum TaxID=4113 RepID=A0ABQ7W767_SOLTU|nr:hypothetical protein KY290_007979 [Solanum tuberosum]